jgi:L-fuculose-phosphate aldolase
VSSANERTVAGATMVKVCRRLYEHGLIAGPDGNVSVRLQDGSILITPRGMPKVDIEPRDLVVVRADGAVIGGARAPSSELRMHLRIYQKRADVRAIVHAHPPIATGFAVAGEGFVAPVLPEIIFQMGEVPLVPYATPGSDALADNIEPFLQAGHDAFLLANHGATAMGPSIDIAHQRMESLEHAARILLAARQLGRVNELNAADVQILRKAREARE